MKTIYPKGKGRIHPSPSSSSPATAAAACGDALAVLKLLPAAIMALAAVLSSEDKEVLAYLITRSMSGGAGLVMAEERRRCRTASGGVHRPALDCGCFDCYTSYWSRWDGSPDRELIHQAIEAFEEHLTSSERAAAAGGGRSRRKDRRAADRAEKGKKNKEKKKKKKAVVEAEEEDKVVQAAVSIGEEKVEKVEEEADEAEKTETVEAAEVAGNGLEIAVAAPAGEKRRIWTDVMGIFNFRLWSLWSPGA